MELERERERKREREKMKRRNTSVPTIMMIMKEQDPVFADLIRPKKSVTKSLVHTPFAIERWPIGGCRTIPPKNA